MGMWWIMATDFPGAPLPKTPEQAEIILHRIRAETESVSLAQRLRSHAWLTERGFPSGLPDHLRPKPEQIHPRVVKAVGIAVRMPAAFREVGVAVERAMADAVGVLAADGADLEDRALVHGYMFEARERTLKQLIGSPVVPRSEI